MVNFWRYDGLHDRSLPFSVVAANFEVTKGLNHWVPESAILAAVSLK
tara:strand:+ start:4464 stop:4604 length:141 start_codon:yes stop_codon:yes gene_type:complete